MAVRAFTPRVMELMSEMRVSGMTMVRSVRGAAETVMEVVAR